MSLAARRLLCTLVAICAAVAASRTWAQAPLASGQRPALIDPAYWQADPAPPPGLDEPPPILTGPENISPLPAPELSPFPINDDVYFEGYVPLLSSGSWLFRGHWYFQGDVMVLHRSTDSHGRATPLSAQAFIGAEGLQIGATALDTASVGFTHEPGARMTLGKFLGRDHKNRDHLLEFTFMGMNEWVTAAAVSARADGPFFLVIPQNPALGGFNFAEQHRFRYWSNLYSYEMNAKIRGRLGRDRLVLTPDGHWQRECTPGFNPTFLAGLRLVSVDEQFTFIGEGFEPADPADLQRGELDIRTTNDLFGVQIGAEAFEQRCNWNFHLRGKVGALVNFADQRTRLDIIDPTGNLSTFTRGEDEQLAFLADVGVGAAYQVRPNMALKLSYDMLLLSGLALAPKQIRFDPAAPPRPHTTGLTFYSGASFGFECVW